MLRKHELVTEDEWEEISFKQTHQKRIDYIFQHLPRNGEHTSHMELAVKMKRTATKPNMITSQQPMMMPLTTNATQQVASLISVMLIDVFVDACSLWSMLYIIIQYNRHCVGRDYKGIGTHIHVTSISWGTIG